MAKIPTAEEIYKRLLEEHLRDIGVDPKDILSYRELRNGDLIIATEYSSITIDDPTIVKFAELADSEVYRPSKEKNELLLELWGTEVVYGWKETSWEDFLADNGHLLYKQLEKMLDRSRGLYISELPDMKEDAGIVLYEMLSSKPELEAWEYCIENMSQSEVLSLLARMSVTPNPEIDFVYYGGRAILAPKGFESQTKAFYVL